MMRYFDPKLGRYITSDPIGLGGGLNTYLYANANPINSIDFMGLNAWNTYQQNNPGNTSTQNSVNYRAQQLKGFGAGSSGNAAGAAANAIGIMNGNITSACQMKWGAKLDRILFELEMFINDTSECQTVYWQIDFFVGRSGCKTDYQLYRGTDKSVYHSFLSADGGWSMTRGKTKGRKSK